MKKYKIDEIIENIAESLHKRAEEKGIYYISKCYQSNLSSNKIFDILAIIFFIIGYFTIQQQEIFGTFILFNFILLISFFKAIQNKESELLGKSLVDYAAKHKKQKPNEFIESMKKTLDEKKD